MERMRDGVRLGCLGFWLNCCLLAGCLDLWLGGFARLESLARGFARLGSLARLLPLGRLPGSLARGICQAWVSGSTDPEKVPAFFEFVGTFFHAKPIETHRDSFHCAIWLDAGTFSNRISYRPANKLTDAAGTVYSPAFSTDSGRNKFTSQNIL